MKTSTTASRINQLVKTASSIGLLITITSLGTSCASQAVLEGMSGHYTPFTERLWEATSEENATIEIGYSEIPEAALIEDAHSYSKNDERQFYYIHRTEEQHKSHLTMRVLATPVAVTADACIEGIVILVLAFAAFGAA